MDAATANPVELLGRVRELYETICKRKLGDDYASLDRRVRIIAELEGLVGRQFRNTKEFHEIVSDYIKRQGRRWETHGARLRRARRRARLTQGELAALLGVTPRMVINYEKNKNPLSAKALSWLGGQNGSSGENVKSEGRESLSLETRNPAENSPEKYETPNRVECRTAPSPTDGANSTRGE